MMLHFTVCKISWCSRAKLGMCDSLLLLKQKKVGLKFFTIASYIYVSIVEHCTNMYCSAAV